MGYPPAKHCRITVSYVTDQALKLSFTVQVKSLEQLPFLPMEG